MIYTRCDLLSPFKLIALSIFLVFFGAHALNAQVDLSAYEGEWEGHLPSTSIFSFDISLEEMPSDLCMLTIANSEGELQKTVQFKAEEMTEVRFSKKLLFRGQMNEDKSSISGFVHAGMILYHVQLNRVRDKFYSGKWNIFMVDRLLSTQIYLSIEKVGVDLHEVYPLFLDERFRGTWAANFKRDGNILRFEDMRAGLQFRCKLDSGEIVMDIQLAGMQVANTFPLFPNWTSHLSLHLAITATDDTGSLRIWSGNTSCRL